MTDPEQQPATPVSDVPSAIPEADEGDWVEQSVPVEDRGDGTDEYPRIEEQERQEDQ